jgi:hypothetical protein
MDENVNGIGEVFGKSGVLEVEYAGDAIRIRDKPELDSGDVR